MIAQESNSEQVQPVILVGNPNVGKSALFGALSGKYVEVSNYPGTTVDFSSGWVRLDGARHKIYDSPGADTLSPVSEDEIVTRDLILANPDSPIICVIDSKNLSRGLVLLSQLAELNRKVVVTLNMADEAASAGIVINTQALSRLIGVPVIPTIATEKVGIEELKKALHKAAAPTMEFLFGDAIENAVHRISNHLDHCNGFSRGISLSYLCGDNGMARAIAARLPSAESYAITRIKSRLQSSMAEPLGFVIAKTRNDQARMLVEQVVNVKSSAGGRVLRRIGELSHHPVYGVPTLLLAIVGLYCFVGVFGAQVLVNIFEKGLFGSIINPLVTRLFSHVPLPFLRELFVGQYGIVTMALTYALALIFPIVTTFFLAFGILEDSGYLPRLAFMVDRIFKKIGLNGRAVLPMILGLGCDTMAVLTTRILATRKEKLMVTFLLALAIPCSAQLGITLGILGAISPIAVGIWITVVLGVLFLVGYVSSKVIPGRSSDFILEIPPLRLPRIQNVIVKTLMRLEWYLREAVPLFILGTLILFVLDQTGLLQIIERLFSPIVVGILGLPATSSQAFILGFLRRDYGAAGFKSLFDSGMLTPAGALVAMTTITLFVPCIANFLIIIKERGLKSAIGMALFIVPFAIGVGGLLNLLLKGIGLWQ